MRYTTPVLALAVLLLVAPSAAATVSPGSTASTAVSPVEQLPDEAREDRDQARGLAADLADAEPADQVHLLAQASGHDLSETEVPDLTAAGAVEALAARDGGQVDGEALRADLADLPDGAEDPLATILSAVVAAHDLRTEAFSDLTADEVDRLREHRAALHHDGAEEPTVTVETQDPLAPEVTLGGDEADPQGLEALAEKVDRTKLLQAQAVLLAAGEEARPALEDVADGLDAAEASHANPAPVDHAPYLAVDATSGTHYTTNYWVSIDLVGSDTYENNAGGTAISTASTSYSAPVGLAVDVLGRDTYRFQEKTSPVDGGPVAAVQGGGSLGVAALVDLVGSDSYTADLKVAPTASGEPTEDFDPLVVAQGAGSLGVGALVDAVGPNDYEARAATAGGNPTLVAQGAGQLGAGLQAGNPSNTTYVAEATTVPHTVDQGDGFLLEQIGLAGATAQGAGVGALVDAGGGDTYRAHTSGGQAVTGAQGAGSPVAALVDAGIGTDRYTNSAIVAPDIDASYHQDCPDGLHCFPFLSVTVQMGDAAARGQGQGALGGLGVLADLGPDPASLEATAFSSPSGTATVGCDGGADCTGRVQIDLSAEDGTAGAQGSSGPLRGSGVLLGPADVTKYRANAVTDARAVAQVQGNVNTCEAEARAGDAVVQAQGSGDGGVGVLADPAGADRYAVSQSTDASATECGSSGDASAGDLLWTGQAEAAGAGVGALVDAAGEDTYSAPLGTSASNEACWTNSPPSVTTLDPNVGIGIDAGPGLEPGDCVLPPN
jgi:hypothetical protein